MPGGVEVDAIIQLADGRLLPAALIGDEAVPLAGDHPAPLHDAVVTRA